MEDFNQMKTGRITIKRCECGNPKDHGADACPRCLRIEKGGWGARRGGGDRSALSGVSDPVDDLDTKGIRRALNKWLDDRGLNDNH